MLHIADYNHPSHEKIYSPRRKCFAHEKGCMIKNYEDVLNTSSDEVHNAQLQVSAIPVLLVAYPTLPDTSQPNVRTTNDNMYQWFERA